MISIPKSTDLSIMKKSILSFAIFLLGMFMAEGVMIGNRCPVSQGDIGIVLDGSCQSEYEYDKIISVLKDMVQTFTMSAKGKRFSFVTYKDYPDLHSTFVDLRYQTTQSMSDLIANTKCDDGSKRRLDLALVMAMNMFSEGGGMRVNVRNTLILITRGKQVFCQKCAIRLDDMKEWIKKLSVQVIVVSIGRHENIAMLKSLAAVGKDSRVFQYNKIDNFVSGSKNMKEAVCKSIETPGCPPRMMMGLAREYAAKSCKELLDLRSSPDSGIYWINPTGSQALQVYCDMKMSGGGWTLVWSYTFTNYKRFRAGSNAVTPQPSWPTTGNIVRSVDPPLSQTHYAALDFKLWKEIGHEFIIKSNINHWLECSEGSGSLVNWKTGSINCKVIKNVATKCHNYVPDTMILNSAGDRGNTLGPDFIRSKSKSRMKEYYYFEGSTRTANWPTHDPCGTNALNHVKGIDNPHGNIFIR